MAVSISINLNNIIIQDNYQYTYKMLETIRQEVSKGSNIDNFNFQAIKEQLEKQCNSWINKMNNLEKNFNQVRIKSYQYGLNKQSIREKSIDNTAMAKLQVSYNNYMNLILHHVKEGYKLLHLIRESFTNQDITYRILNRDTNGTMFEKIYSLEEILEATVLGKNYANDENVDMKRITSFQIQLQKQTSIEGGEDSYYSFGMALYQQLEDLFLYTKKDAGSKKFFNRGHIYEVYVYLTETKGINGNRPLGDAQYPFNSKHMTWNLVKKAREAARNSTTGLQGGDQAGRNQQGQLQSQQLKNISNAGASLMTSLTIRNSIDSILEALNKTNKQEIVQELSKTFSQDISKDSGSFTHELERSLNDAVIEGLKATFGLT